MEKKGINQENSRKINISVGKNNKLAEVIKFYNEKIKKTHIIFFVITVILYTIAFIATIVSVKSGNVELIAAKSFLDNIKEYALLDIVIILAGITPYFFLPVLGVAQSIIGVSDLASRYVSGLSFIPTLYIGGLIQMIGVSLCVAVGIYYCRLSSKKNKYYHHSDFSFSDVKMQIYEIRKNEEKVQELAKKKEEKAKEMEKCNVKIPYMNFILLGLIAFVIGFIGILISMI